jgi:hypothetical protein
VDPTAGVAVYERGGLIHDRLIDERHRAGTDTLEFNARDDIPVLYAAIVTGRYRQTTRFINSPGRA